MQSEPLEQVLVVFGNGHCRAPRGRDLFEVGGIVGVLDWGLPGDSGVADVGPVELPEPTVLLDVLAVVASAQSFGGVGV